MNDKLTPRVAVSIGIVFGLLAMVSGLYQGLDLFEILAWRFMPSFIFSFGLTWLSLFFIYRIVGETIESEVVERLSHKPETTGREIDLTSEPEPNLLDEEAQKTKQEPFQDLKIPNA